MKKLKWSFVGMIGLGVLLGVVSLCMFGWDFNKVYAAVTQEKYYSEFSQTVAADGKTEVSLDMGNNSVVINKTDGDELKLVWWEHSRYTEAAFQADRLDGEQVYLKLREKFAFRVNLWNADKYRQVALEVPESFDGKVNIVSHNGRVEVSDVVLAELSVVNHNGRTAVSNCRIDIVTAVNYNGRIETNGVECENLNLTSNNGRIEVIDTTARYVTVKNRNGRNEVTLRGKQDDYLIEFKNHNGRSYLNGGRVQNGVAGGLAADRWGSVYIETYNGRNRLNFQ